MHIAEESIVLSLDKVKNYLRITDSYEDDLLLHFIKVAEEMAENYIGSPLIAKKLLYQTNNLYKIITLPKKPLQSIEYIYLVNNYNKIYLEKNEYSIHEINNQLELKNLTDFNYIVICYIAGYGSKELIPASIIQAILLHIASLYDNRGSEYIMPISVQEIYRSYRVIGG